MGGLGFGDAEAALLEEVDEGGEVGGAFQGEGRGRANFGQPGPLGARKLDAHCGVAQSSVFGEKAVHVSDSSGFLEDVIGGVGA